MLNQGTSKPRLQLKFDWKIALCVLILFSVLIRLGFWQLDRAKQKQQIRKHRDALLLAAPVAIESLDLDNIDALKYTKVKLEGSYDNNRSILINNQVFQNQPGYEVITVFKLLTSEQVVFVSRGWVPADLGTRQLPLIDHVAGRQQLLGKIHVPSSNAFFLPQNIDRTTVWPLRLNHLYINHIRPIFNKPLLPFVVRLERNNPGIFVRHWQEKQLQSANSISYAIQWFAMALILVVITLIKSSNILEIIRSIKST